LFVGEAGPPNQVFHQKERKRHEDDGARMQVDERKEGAIAAGDMFVIEGEEGARGGKPCGARSADHIFPGKGGGLAIVVSEFLALFGGGEGGLWPGRKALAFPERGHLWFARRFPEKH